MRNWILFSLLPFLSFSAFGEANKTKNVLIKYELLQTADAYACAQKICDVAQKKISLSLGQGPCQYNEFTAVVSVDLSASAEDEIARLECVEGIEEPPVYGIAQSSSSQPSSDPVPFVLGQLSGWWGGARSRSIEARSASPEDTRFATVVVTDSDLLDDSVRATRTVFKLEANPAGEWKIIERTELYRCQPGRGHQHFSPELCL
ncbi:MAG: hypothetical protein AB7G93_19370 [Bdellovibrionales bacterium]